MSVNGAQASIEGAGIGLNAEAMRRYYMFETRGYYIHIYIATREPGEKIVGRG